MARILFIGAGAVGSYIGGWLSHTGHDVTLVEHWAEQVEKISKDGVELTGPHETIIAHPRMVHLHSAESLAREEPFDIGFIAVKAYDTKWAATFIDPLVSLDGFIVSAQNCWPDPIVASVVGAERSVGLVMSGISVQLFQAGTVNRPGTTRKRDTGYVVFRAGNHDGSDSPRLQTIIDMLDPIDAGLTTNNLWGERWAKMCQNCMSNPVAGITGMGSAELAGDPRCRQLNIHLAKEAAGIGLALGLDVVKFAAHEATFWTSVEQPEKYAEVDGMIAQLSQGPNRFPSMGQDVAKERQSEIRYMNGHVQSVARENSIKVPVTDAIVEAMQKIDDGSFKPDRANVDWVLEKAGIPAPDVL
jgi:2-dehydropantoate 2-reductase